MTIILSIIMNKNKTKDKQELNIYIWEGIDQRGTVMKGELQSISESMARASLRQQNIQIIQKLQIKKKPLFSFGNKIKSKDISIFSRQLATMTKSGVPLLSSIDIMANGYTNPRMVKLLQDVRNDLSTGLSLHEALGQHPLYFDELFVNLVHAGENSGALEEILETIATYKEKSESLKGKVKKALFYPIVVIFVAIIVSAILLLYVVPQFENIFKGFGADLPLFTQMIVNASRFLQSYWWIIIGASVFSWIGFSSTYKRSDKLRHTMDKILLRLPVLGKIFHGSAIARFSRTLAITFKAGVPLVEGLHTVSGATGSETYKQAVLKIENDVSVGYALNVAMKQVDLFPHFVVQMAAIGEEAGSLDTMLTKVADFYEEEVNNTVDALSSILEPFIMVILGVLVGGMVIGMYLPIFKMAETI